MIFSEAAKLTLMGDRKGIVGELVVPVFIPTSITDGYTNLIDKAKRAVQSYSAHLVTEPLLAHGENAHSRGLWGRVEGLASRPSGDFKNVPSNYSGVFATINVLDNAWGRNNLELFRLNYLRCMASFVWYHADDGTSQPGFRLSHLTTGHGGRTLVRGTAQQNKESDK